MNAMKVRLSTLRDSCGSEGCALVIFLTESGIEIGTGPVFGAGIEGDEGFRERPPAGGGLTIFRQRELARLVRVVMQPAFDDVQLVHVVLRDNGEGPHPRAIRRRIPSSIAPTFSFC